MRAKGLRSLSARRSLRPSQLHNREARRLYSPGRDWRSRRGMWVGLAVLGVVAIGVWLIFRRGA
jgi:hypothetical protein